MFLFVTFSSTVSYAQPGSSCSTATVMNLPGTVLPFYTPFQDSMRYQPIVTFTASPQWYKFTVPQLQNIHGFLIGGGLYGACSTVNKSMVVSIKKGNCSSLNSVGVKGNATIDYCLNGGGPGSYTWDDITNLAVVDSVCKKTASF